MRERASIAGRATGVRATSPRRRSRSMPSTCTAKSTIGSWIVLLAVL